MNFNFKLEILRFCQNDKSFGQNYLNFLKEIKYSSQKIQLVYSIQKILEDSSQGY